MDTVESLLRILAGYGLLILLGFGLASSGLSRTPYRKFAIFMAPATGYAALCFFSIWFSGLTGTAVVVTNLWAAGALSAWSLIVALRDKASLVEVMPERATFLGIVVPMLVLSFFPLLWSGIGLYLGTVNPDFEQSLEFHEALMGFHSKFWVLYEDLPLQGAFAQHFFPEKFQARFGGVTFSILLEQIFGGTSRAALMNAIADFLLCVPPAIYAFCRIVLEFERKSAAFSAIMVSVAAPTTMSLIHSFVGQNSALAMFPIALTLFYISIRESRLTVACFAAVVLNGIFWLYSVILPYILAPIALFIFVTILCERKRNIGALLVPLVGFAVATAAIHLSVLSTSVKFVQDLSHLLSHVKFIPLYLDFLSEEVFEYATGLTSYPVTQSLLFANTWVVASPILTALGALIAGAYLVALRVWLREVTRSSALFVLSLLVVYVGAWIKYTFITRYGYAPFKMAQWLQFISVPLLCWYLLRIWDRRIVAGGIFKLDIAGPLLLLGPIFVGLNLISTIDYGLLGLTTGRPRSALINSYGIGGNPDFSGLSDAIRGIVPANSTIAVGFGDMIENYWAAYYLGEAKFNVTILSHEPMPTDDAYLPDVKSRAYTDSLGAQYQDKQEYFNKGVADYYLLSGLGNSNVEILDMVPKGVPLWQNSTFRLYQRDGIKDLFVTGRGFYRAEQDTANHPSWWWPRTFRWVAQGGELYQINPARPGVGYRLAFDVISGVGVASGRRTLEIWHNDEKFDEVVVDGVARVVSKPYMPKDGANRLVIRAKEVPVSTPRRIGLWNRDLPQRAAPINFLLSNISAFPEDSPGSGDIAVAGERIESLALFDKVTSLDGVSVDGWVGEQGRLCIRTADTVAKIYVNVLIPGNLGFAFPYRVDTFIDGVKSIGNFADPGEQTFEFAVPAKSGEFCHQIEIVPERAIHVADGIEQREVVRSIRLNYLRFD
jgi:hypothetical protein